MRATSIRPRRHARACPGHPRPPFRAKNVDGRDVGAKQSFVASPGHDADRVTGIHVLAFVAITRMSLTLMRATRSAVIRRKREARLSFSMHHLRHARACPGHPRPPCRAKNEDGRDVGAKQSFVASPGHDADCVTGVQVFLPAAIAWAGSAPSKASLPRPATTTMTVKLQLFCAAYMQQPSTIAGCGVNFIVVSPDRTTPANSRAATGECDEARIAAQAITLEWDRGIE